MGLEILSGGESAEGEQLRVLSRNICALQVVSGGAGALRWGPVIKLPKGTQVEFFGAGFNKHTVRVKVGSSFYFVFRDDLDREIGFPAGGQQLTTNKMTPRFRL